MKSKSNRKTIIQCKYTTNICMCATNELYFDSISRAVGHRWHISNVLSDSVLVTRSIFMKIYFQRIAFICGAQFKVKITVKEPKKRAVRNNKWDVTLHFICGTTSQDWVIIVGCVWFEVFFDGFSKLCGQTKNSSPDVSCLRDTKRVHEISTFTVFKTGIANRIRSFR